MSTLENFSVSDNSLEPFRTGLVKLTWMLLFVTSDRTMDCSIVIFWLKYNQKGNFCCGIIWGSKRSITYFKMNNLSWKFLDLLIFFLFVVLMKNVLQKKLRSKINIISFLRCALQKYNLVFINKYIDFKIEFDPFGNVKVVL